MTVLSHVPKSIKNDPTIITLAVAAFLLFGIPSVQAASTAFMKLDGIEGESQRVDHEDEIDILSWNWGVDASAMSATGNSRMRSAAACLPLEFHKYVDAASAPLFLSTLQGAVIKEGILSVRKDSGEAHLDYLVIRMENIRISSVFSGGSEGSIPVETVSLNFEKIQLKYTVQADDHSAGEEVSFSWDCSRNIR